MDSRSAAHRPWRVEDARERAYERVEDARERAEGAAQHPVAQHPLFGFA